MTTRFLLLLFGLSLITGCSIPNHVDRADLDRLRAKGNQMTFKNSEYDSAWNRARKFVKSYSLCPVIRDGDTIIETKAPCFFCSGCGYKIFSRHLSDSETYVTVSYKDGIAKGFLNVLNAYGPARNIYILADYMKTDSLPNRDLIWR
jgi:hypothetical protein